MDFHARQKKGQGQLGSNRLDALLVKHLPNVRYLCGFTGSSAGMVLTENRSLFFSDGRYITQAKEEVRKSRILIGRQAPLLSAADWLVANTGKAAKSKVPGLTIGIDGEHLTVSARTRLAKVLGHAFKLKEAPPLVERARVVKDPEEIKLLRA